MKFVLPLISFALAVFGLFQYISSVDQNMCDMTYMFEYPEYIKVPLKYENAFRFPRYNLYVYGEGKYAEQLEKGRMEGYPILFIPGNAGSHRQVRSLASVALRMGHSLQTSQSSDHFNFFTIDFNEEISGLYGGTLQEQTEFVAECINHIISIYSSKKIVLIGHSMGGVIAKAVFSLPFFHPNNVSLIITLASPLKKPVLAVDSAIVNFYEKTTQAWKYRLKDDLNHIPIVSIGGSYRDYLVRSDLVLNDFTYSSELDVHAFTTAIPGVWLSTDHLAITWCKQLILTICRSLFDMKELQANQVIEAGENKSLTVKKLRHHFITRSSGKHFPRMPLLPAAIFTTSGQWIELESSTWRFHRTKVLSTIYLLIPLTQKDRFVVLASGLVKVDWIFGCTKLSQGTTKTCSEGDNLSDRAEIIPSKSKTVERRMVHLNLEKLKKLKEYSYILIHVTPVNSPVEILGESYNHVERNKYFKLPTFTERLIPYSPLRILSVSLAEQNIFYNITFSRSSGVFEAAEFQLETRLCKAGSVVGQGFIKQHAPWSSEDTFHHIRATLGGQTFVPVRVGILPPPGFSNDVNLQIFLDPECSVVLFARFPLDAPTSQYVKFYGTYAFGYVVAVLLALFSGQMHSIGKSVYSMLEVLFKWTSSFWIWIRHRNVLNATLVPLEQTLRKEVKMSKVVLFYGALLASVSAYFSSSVAIIMAFIYYFLVLMLLHARCRAEEERRGTTSATLRWYFHFSLVLLYACVVMLVSPGFIAWFKNLEFSLRVPNDPYNYPCTTIILCSYIIWALPAPCINRVKYEITSHLVHCIAVITSIYCILSLYRLFYILCSVFVIVWIQQTYAFYSSPWIKYD
ncbi:GPI inositol-deacylase-like [Uloborus diversus]|uniref:GPI inositol-deacylase-like n=1 Tax=Uloborus diversus TaxID=327109 RepID=UPI00240A6624|nr:GPI inositol-deacylase-like [Uloborus diversus]